MPSIVSQQRDRSHGAAETRTESCDYNRPRIAKGRPRLMQYLSAVLTSIVKSEREDKKK